MVMFLSHSIRFSKYQLVEIWNINFYCFYHSYCPVSLT